MTKINFNEKLLKEILKNIKPVSFEMKELKPPITICFQSNKKATYERWEKIMAKFFNEV